MGNQGLTEHCGRESRARHARHLLDDLRALQMLLDHNAFDAGPARIGAEQELHLLDSQLAPAPAVHSILDELRDPRFTTELALFNLEANLTPRTFGGRCLAELEAELRGLCTRARSAAAREGLELLLTGYLPTYEPGHAGLHQMVSKPRFSEVNRASMEPRGGGLELFIRGRDTLEMSHDNIMLEGGATSFQLHLQVAPREFAEAFNCALLIAAPVLAACANSPLLFSHRLWHESRVPLLELSGDMRTGGQLARPGRSRTLLGHGWVERSVLEVFQRDLCVFPAVLGSGAQESSTAAVQAGRAPSLAALCDFNGTVWRWIRPCYGITNGRPHLRIENRILPAGPTVLDEVANAALWLGLMKALPGSLGELSRRLPFCEAENNFHSAARAGLDAPLRWLGGRCSTARSLLETELLPLAREGLRIAGIEAGDIDRYLGIVESRVSNGRTGAAWMLAAFDAQPEALPPREKSWLVTGELAERCWSEQPVHQWGDARPRPRAARVPPVSAVLCSDFVAITGEVPAVLAERQLEWSGRSHLVVEDARGEFAGLLCAEDFARWRRSGSDSGAAVASLLRPATAPTLRLEEPADTVLARMQRGRERCAVVLQGTQAAGLVFVGDLLRALGKDEEPAELRSDAC